MPIYFWNDPDHQKYQNAYFNKFEKVWHHGDYIRISKNGSMKIYGRSDATLNPGGVRIGTSEIYRVIEKIDKISDSLVVGQSWKGDQRIILFLKMREGYILNKSVENMVKQMIKKTCSPRHVPAVVLETKEIPYTINGKKVEMAVKKIIEGNAVDNTASLQNPEVLDFYKNIFELTT